MDEGEKSREEKRNTSGSKVHSTRLKHLKNLNLLNPQSNNKKFLLVLNLFFIIKGIFRHFIYSIFIILFILQVVVIIIIIVIMTIVIVIVIITIVIIVTIVIITTKVTV